MKRCVLLPVFLFAGVLAAQPRGDYLSRLLLTVCGIPIPPVASAAVITGVGIVMTAVAVGVVRPFAGV
jgi:hypothetical protein